MGLEVPCKFRFYSEDQKCVKKSRELLGKASYTTNDIKTHFQVKVNSTVTRGPVKIKVEYVEDYIGNDKSATVEVPQSKIVIYEVRRCNVRNVVLKKSEGATERYSRQWLCIGGI